LRAGNVAGNVTIPHKSAMFALCDCSTDVAAAAGAVNTFWFVDGKLYGDNTDVGGFDSSVRHLLGVIHEHARVTLLGAGGAASAVAAATAQWPGTTLTIWNRTVSSARELAQRFHHARVETDLTRAVQQADLVVNATSIGLRDSAHPVEVALLPPHAAVIDLVYMPGETAWVRAARASGHLAEDGLVMLVEQGALAFRRWFGVEPDRTVMWRAIYDHLTPTASALGRQRKALVR
jgi:shikimate dehydrogenase